MKKFFVWYESLSSRMKTSMEASIAIVGFISTVMTILGVSINGCIGNIWYSILIVVTLLIVLGTVAYFVIGSVYKNSVSLMVRNTPISITAGDIFHTEGWRVIGCDTHFDIRVDDVIISKKSLHGKLVLEHGNKDEIKLAVEEEAKRLGLLANDQGLYDFPLGTVIPYYSSKEKETYLMLAMTELDSNYEAHTNMAEFEHMLMKMWSEIGRVYASHDIVLPLLGTGISRFDDGPKEKSSLLKCMLCTLNASGVTLNSNVKVVIWGDAKDIPFYEYKGMFQNI